MSETFKFSYENINENEVTAKIHQRGAYYANVVEWTLLFSIPIFWLLDLLFLKDEWVELLLLRVIVGMITYVVYILGSKLKWNYLQTLKIFVGISVFLHALICGLVPVNHLLPYFLFLSVVVLLLNATLFWNPSNSLVICFFTYAVIAIFFALKTRADRYDVLISHGGGIYFLVSFFSCAIAYNRFDIIKRNIEKNIIIQNSQNSLILQHEKINNQKFIIEESNRKLEILSNYRKNTVNILMHDFRNFTSSIHSALELLKSKSENLTTEQHEILNYIGVGNEKLNYLSEKLATSAEKDETNVDFHLERLELGKQVEQVAIEISDAANIKHINVQLHLSATPIYVQLDKLFLDQVLFKLLTNVIRYAQSGTILTIHSHKSSDKAIVEIVNTGKLIGIELLNKLFNKLSNDKIINNIEGDEDMGFAVAKKLAETMNGKLFYNSEESTGNYFRLEFNSTH